MDETQEAVGTRRRSRARTRKEWLNIYQHHKNDLTAYEKELLKYALRLNDDFPRPPFEVKRVIEAHAAPVMPVVSPTVTTQVREDLKIDLDELFKEGKTERSLNYLRGIQPPQNYNPRPTIEQLRESFKKNNYFISEDDIFTVHQAISSGRPIKVDGPPGVGKTTLAEQIAIAMGLDHKNPLHYGELFVTPDISKEEAFYRWNDALRLIDMQTITGLSGRFNNEELKRVYVQISDNAYSPRYLDVNVMVRACVLPYSTVCLVDEMDKAYHEFDNYLLNVVDKNYFAVPEYGRVGREKHDPKTAPIFVLTSNMTRALSGPLVRRCKSVFFDYLDETLEAKVVHAKTGMSILEAGKIAAFFKKVRKHEKLRLQQPPSPAEVIETARAMKEHNIDVTEKNLFKMHGHWIKYRVDYNAIAGLFLNNGVWSERME